MFTTVANCSSLQQAQSLQIALEAAGIDSFIPDEISAGLTPHYFLTPAGVRLQVHEEDLEAARQVLRNHEASSGENAQPGS